jgi:hypothetical protein
MIEVYISYSVVKVSVRKLALSVEVSHLLLGLTWVETRRKSATGMRDKNSPTCAGLLRPVALSFLAILL